MKIEPEDDYLEQQRERDVPHATEEHRGHPSMEAVRSCFLLANRMWIHLIAELTLKETFVVRL